ncbi:PH domain-containing protein [Rossellomorea sp. NS-SX7]|uniref:PH domain-containing protein n=1 Tax=Rossellomorea sp. NS-SX7 TaxID=3463856 RepID=UPI004059D42F
MSEYKRLHPISAVANFLKQLKELIIPFVLLFVLNSRGEKSGFWDYMPLISMGVVLVIVLVAGVLKWLRFTYRLEEGELRIEYGLFVKKKRYIPFDRIQSLNFSEGIIHRPFGLVKVKVETAGSSSPGESEAELTAILKEEALELEKIIYREKKKGQTTEMDEETVVHEKDFPKEEKWVFKMSAKDILVLALTSGGVGVILSGAAVFLSQFSEFIPYEMIFDEVMAFVKSGLLFIAIMSFIILLVAWIFSVGWTFVLYGDFKIRMSDDNIVITRGLLERKQVTVPLNRVQGIRIVENPVRQLFGYCTVVIENAGGSVLDKDSSTIKLMPVVKKKRVPGLLHTLFPEYVLTEEFHRLPKRSLRRYIFRAADWVIIPVVILAIMYWPLGLLSILLVIPFSLLGFFQHRAGGWRITDNQLSLRYRGILKHTAFMKKSRIQSLDSKQSWFQARRNLRSISTTLKSGQTGYSSEVNDLELEDAAEIYNWFSHD